MFLGMQMQTEILTLDEGQYVSPRSTALADTLLLVLGGEGVVELGDEVLVLTRHMTVLVPPGETAGIINEGIDPLIMLRVTSPPE
jgi:mannose-6-phosphate isomerase-like protein (cupin superfamily)